MVKWALAGLSFLGGVISLVLAASAFMAAGTDDVTESRTFTADNGAYAVLLNEQVVPYSHTTATIRATGGQELLIATANGVDSENYLTGVGHEEITAVTFPGDIEHRFVPGDALRANPDSRDWWTSKQKGTDVSTEFSLDGDRQTVVIAAADGSQLTDVQVSMTMKVTGVFGFCVAGLGIAVLAFGVTAFLLLRLWAARIRPRRKTIGTQSVEHSQAARSEAFAAAGIGVPGTQVGSVRTHATRSPNSASGPEDSPT